MRAKDVGGSNAATPRRGEGTTMSTDERIRFLLRAATRAEGEGERRIARIFRRMAQDARPADVYALGPELQATLEWSVD